MHCLWMTSTHRTRKHQGMWCALSATIKNTVKSISKRNWNDAPSSAFCNHVEITAGQHEFQLKEKLAAMKTM